MTKVTGLPGEIMSTENTSSATPVHRLVIRPGRGWSHVAGSVYDHANGLRLHLLGMLRLPSGEHVSANEWPESRSVGFYVRANGGNRKRGLMAWANSKFDG